MGAAGRATESDHRGSWACRFSFLSMPLGAMLRVWVRGQKAPPAKRAPAGAERVPMKRPTESTASSVTDRGGPAEQPAPQSTGLRDRLADRLYRSTNLGLTGGEALALADELVPVILDHLRQKFTVSYIEIEGWRSGFSKTPEDVLYDLAAALGVKERS
jgi:hypothetical protein